MKHFPALFVAAFFLAPPLHAADEPAKTDAATTRSEINADGLVADYYLPAGTHGKLPGVIVLGGSEGGLAGISREARLLSEHGFAVLAVAYFGLPGLPSHLANVPLETFTRALDWLGAQPEVEPQRMGIIGTSKGGEAALLAAARDQRIKAVVAALPSNVSWPGISARDGLTVPSWTENGKAVPFLPYGWNGSFRSVFALYDDGLQDLERHPEAVIPVERIDGPVMLVCGEADTLWPSCRMSLMVRARLQTHNFTHPVTLLKYADAGHGAFGTPIARDNPAYAKLGALGGSTDGNAAARNEAWPKALMFLDVALKSGNPAAR
jgi:uncharacterized protein